MEPVYKLVDAGKRVPILDRLFVECSIVYAHSEIAAFLLHEEYWGTVRGGAGMDESFLDKIRELLLEFLLLSVREPVGGARWWILPFVELDLVVYCSRGRKAGRKIFGEDIPKFVD